VAGVGEIFEAEGEAIAVAVEEILAVAIAVAVGEILAVAIAVVVEATLGAAIEAAVVVGEILAAEDEETLAVIVSEGAGEMISEEGVAAVILDEAEVVAISDVEGATSVGEATSDAVAVAETFEEEVGLAMTIGTAGALLQTKIGETSIHSKDRHNRINGISRLPLTQRAEINFLKEAFHRSNKINSGTNKVDSRQTNSTIRECLSNSSLEEITHLRRHRSPTAREAVFQIRKRSKHTHINNSSNSSSLGSISNSSNRSSNRALTPMQVSRISQHLAQVINRTKIIWRVIAASRTSRHNSSNLRLRPRLRKLLQCNQ